ncbi:MAG: 30S ribosomal protein S17 [Candidatus Omnitrophica bacterium CG1_02_49_10]|nr:MAG: 30S ribosomal protein S17 [Candidatus Omnitrophica bacterium CG1_02_49_10]
MNKNKARGTKQSEKGVVISDKMDKTVVVMVSRTSTYKVYKRTMRGTKKYKVHDENNEAKAGDTVAFVESRPYSKEKRWRIVEIFKKKEAAV